MSKSETAKMPSQAVSVGWLGHARYAFSPSQAIYKTKRDAMDAGWKSPERVQIILKPMRNK